MLRDRADTTTEARLSGWLVGGLCAELMLPTLTVLRLNVFMG